MPSNKTFSSLLLVSGAGLEPKTPSPEILPRHPCELCFRTSSLYNFEEIFVVLVHSNTLQESFLFVQLFYCVEVGFSVVQAGLELFR